MRSYVIFALIFTLAGVVLSFAADIPEPQWLRITLALLSPIAAAVLGVLLAQRSGHLALTCLLVVGLVLSAVIYAATWGVFHFLALGAGDSVPFWRLAQVGGWTYMLGYLSHAIAPVIGRLLVPRPNNAFKPKPLRGSA
ncbi:MULTISPECIES: hypothetical protein [unclassified Luteimonas]